MLAFDNFGNLTPDQPIVSDLSEVEQTFVFNEHRRHLFAKFLTLLDAFSSANCNPIEMWLDGSFATQKENPNDIDVVFFVYFELFEKFEEWLYETRKKYRKDIDAYFVPVYPDNHPLQRLTKSDRIYWLNQFLDDRNGRKKGILQINYQL